MLGSQVVTHSCFPGTVVAAIESGDEGGDVFGGHVDVVSERNQQSAKELNTQPRKYDSTMNDGGIMPVAK